MSNIEPFEKYIDDYEDWFVRNRWTFLSELEAVRRHLPRTGTGVEIGVGSGLFAQPLGIHIGVEPSAKMREKAGKRGVTVISGVAEDLPFKDHFFDFTLMVTTICFLDDARKALTEAWRVLKPGGKLIIGMVDKNSPVGKVYQAHQDTDVFYRYATFYTTAEMVDLMRQSGFEQYEFTQTIFKMLDEIKEPQEVRTGYGNGSFVVVSAVKGNENG